MHLARLKDHDILGGGAQCRQGDVLNVWCVSLTHRVFMARESKLLIRGENMKLCDVLHRISLWTLCTQVYLHVRKRYDCKYRGGSRCVALVGHRPDEGSRHTYKSGYGHKYPPAAKGVIGLFSVIMLLISNSACAAGTLGPIVSPNNQPKISVYKQSSAKRDHWYRLHLKQTASASAGFDSEAENCIKPQGKLVIDGDVGSAPTYIDVYRWDIVSKVHRYSLGYVLTLTNTCARDINAYIGLWNQSDKSTWIGEYISLPAAGYCTVEVSDVNFGELFVNTKKSATLNIIKRGTEGSVVRVSGSSLSSNGDLSLGGDNNVIVQTSDSYKTNINGRTIWQSKTSQSGIPLEITVGSKAKMGVHQSSLTATLTCQ